VTGSDCTSGYCIKGPSGSPYCSKKCSAASECNGGGCHQTNIPGLKVCGNPSQGSPSPAPKPGGGGSLTPPGNKDTTKPTVTITSPSSNASVSPCVTVKASITDKGGIKYATVRVNGTPKGTKTAAPYNFMLHLTAGNSYTITVEAKDKAGNMGKATIKITTTSAAPPQPKPPAPKPPGSGSGSGSGNGSGNGSGGGSTTPPANPKPKGAYGASCTQWNDCSSGMCAHDASLQKSYCTKTCDPANVAPCPAGSTCLGSNGGAYVCAPDLAPGSFDQGNNLSGLDSGCSMGRGSTTSAGPLALLPLIFLLLAVRRRG